MPPAGYYSVKVLFRTAVRLSFFEDGGHVKSGTVGVKMKVKVI